MAVIQRDLFFSIFGDGNIIGNPPMFTGSDIMPLISFSRTFHPQTVIEIGIQRGETAKCILDNSPWIKQYIGIDVPPEYHTALAAQRNEVPRKAGDLVRHDPRVKLIVRPNGSRDVGPFELPAADLIFIDGDHSLEGVLADTQLCREVIRKGGIICWHDYGNHIVPDVTVAIDSMNIKEGNRICLIEGGTLCFQICREGR